MSNNSKPKPNTISYDAAISELAVPPVDHQYIKVRYSSKTMTLESWAELFKKDGISFNRQVENK